VIVFQDENDLLLLIPLCLGIGMWTYLLWPKKDEEDDDATRAESDH
jgi:hypothetical protein